MGVLGLRVLGVLGVEAGLAEYRRLLTGPWDMSYVLLAGCKLHGARF